MRLLHDYRDCYFYRLTVCLSVPGLGLQLLQYWSGLLRSDGHCQVQHQSFAVYVGSWSWKGATKC